ncbi:hypothetical protein SK128_007466 [Halocaridina rubra]|uniref:Uncharacterized protein n=1 Tax=Halocaridina rubra TaxID=373956 RepID=A0AAN9ABA8_HALRR
MRPTTISSEDIATSRSNQNTPTKTNVKSDTDSGVLGSLFELGMKDLEIYEERQNEEPPINAFLNEIKELPFLPLADDNKSGNHHEKDHQNRSPVLWYLDTIRGDVWAQFKALVLGYSNWLEEEYQIQDISEKLPIGLIKKLLDMGDRVNFLHVIGKRVDKGLAKHLADKLQPLFDQFEHLNPGRSFGHDLSSAIQNLIRDTAWNTMHQFVDHVLSVAERFVSRKDIEEFQIELAQSSPLVAKGLEFVLNGPSKDPSDAREEGRYMSSRRDYIDYDDGYGYNDRGGYDHDVGGYGGHGGHDDGYGVSNQGYKSGAHLDPYLILGGLGAAALLAYLAFKVIATTAGARRRRSDDLTFMELSDMPNIVYSFYNILEGADEKYNSNLPIQLDDTEDLVRGLNTLWFEHQKENGCVRCSLFTFVRDHFSLGHNVADNLLVASVAHLVGAENSGQLVDEVTRALVEGQQVNCVSRNYTCYVK